ncbi:MAG TPA: HAD family hydrolase [Anaerolineales bacterium]|nr:HAD family hydrolase [Anaerolineales bacterium]
MPGLERARIRALCLDLDGTLLETDDALVQRLERWLVWRPQRKRRSLARRLVMAAEGPANRFLALVDRLGVDEALGPLVDGLHRQRGLAPVGDLRPVEGALPAVRRLAQHYSIALVTAREARSATAFLQTFGLTGAVRCTVTARTTRRGKPDPAPILWAATSLGVPPKACLVVGDTTVDIRAGRAAGAQTVGVLSGFGERAELERAGAGLILESVAELPEVLMGEP